MPAVAWPARAPDTWDGLVDGFTADTVGALAVVEAALPGMRGAGCCRIVLISSDVVEQPIPAATVAYLGSAANGHVNGEVLSLAGERQLTR